MKRALLYQNKLKFVDGCILVPSSSDPTFDAWKRCNMMVVSWIPHTMSPQLAQSTLYIDDALDLWLDLQERYSKGDHFRFSDLPQEIHSMRQGDRTISSFFTDLKDSLGRARIFAPYTFLHMYYNLAMPLQSSFLVCSICANVGSILLCCHQINHQRSFSSSE